MEFIFLLLTIIALLATIIFGFLQVVIPFIKKEVRFSKRFPFVEGVEETVPAAKKSRRRRKKKKRRSLVPIFAVAVAIIIIVLVKALVLQTAPVEPKPIVVITFKNRTGESSFDYLCEAIPNLLITNLEQSKFLSVMTWERMHDLLKAMGKGDVESVDENLGFELCYMEGVDVIIIGSFTKAGDMFVTDVKVLDVTTKEILRTTSSKGEGVASILKTQIDELSRDISKSVSIYERTIGPTKRRVTDVTTSSVEAYNYFLRGRDDLDKFYYDDARRFLEKAVELDSTFASAYLYLAKAYDGLGNVKLRDRAYEKAKIFSAKATEKERLYIQIATEKDSEKRFRIRKELAKKYPNEKRVHADLGDYYYAIKLYSDALHEYNKALELDPNYGSVINGLAYLYADMDNFERAIEYFQRYASVSPGDANPFDSMGDLYFIMGDLDAAVAKYKEALEVKPDFGSEWKIAYIYALKEKYTEAMKWVDQFIVKAPSPGRKAEAYFWKCYFDCLLGSIDQSLEDLDKVTELAEEAGNNYWKAWADLLKGRIYYDQGETERSRQYYKNSFDMFLETFPSIKSYLTAAYNFNFGLLDLKEGHIDSAKSKLAQMKSLVPEVRKERIRYQCDVLHTEVLLAEDSIETALAVCENITLLELPAMLSDEMLLYNLVFSAGALLANVNQQKGELDKAIAEYERLITFDPSSKERRLIPPKFHYHLAKLYEKRDANVKAIEQYEKFLAIWKDADKDLPELIDAKKQLARLKAAT
jgi:tetratricopeptide (TPR) repeat protein/TolB-like protein